MSTDPNQERIEQLKAEHDQLINDLPAVGGIRTPTFRRQALGPEVHAREAQKRAERKTRLGDQEALDLSDAMELGIKDPKQDELRDLENATRTMGDYHQSLNRLLSTMQGILLESIRHIEELQRHFERLR